MLLTAVHLFFCSHLSHDFIFYFFYFLSEDRLVLDKVRLLFYMLVGLMVVVTWLSLLTMPRYCGGGG